MSQGRTKRVIDTWPRIKRRGGSLISGPIKLAGRIIYIAAYIGRLEVANIFNACTVVEENVIERYCTPGAISDHYFEHNLVEYTHITC